MTRVLLIDNYDSFTYNLSQAFQVLGARVDVIRNDALTVNDAHQIHPSHLVISPGPGHPRAAGVSAQMISAFMGKIPVLGVCLGHQTLATVMGATVAAASRLVHGEPSEVTHDCAGVFDGLPQRFLAGRYHSLAVDPATLPDEIEVTARTDDGEVMGIRHRRYTTCGVQFHPESVLTPLGNDLLANFLGLKGGIR